MTDIRKALSDGIVTFKYRKVNGEERTAVGTTNRDAAGDGYIEPRGTGTVKEGVISYFDTEAQGWRSFREENFIGIL